jgi:hypothetical protein
MACILADSIVTIRTDKSNVKVIHKNIVILPEEAFSVFIINTIYGLNTLDACLDIFEQTV